ncbi:hypothetical protein EIN_316050 [Entamoeba invadens IP1]|uniref:F-BAR domain-containing protein n=1 Tax=Entamoeba invadens IP1 TaxID=370355 RepID=A0A0A1U5A7_ENTIV|nr:hypothetical protein EIN_316050 [Entamoeba invadens IP1]ELP86946.1 hypothetical protein EIN_316050 [Entamoeba invadens IP1]|eukprot:XP_004253717.1 hypothetical protein EIN_316050 [Entamoeba invadens IP1]
MSTEQVASLTFEFETIAKKLDYQINLTKAYSSLFTQRGQTEIDYAKHLLHQCGTPLKVGNILMKRDVPLDLLETTAKVALTSFNTNTLKVAQKHNEMGVIFIEQASKPLDNLSRTMEANRKRIVSEFLARLKNSQTLARNAERAEEQYKRAVAELKQVTAQLNTAMTQNVAMVDRLVAKKQQVVARVQQSEAAYKAAVEKANAYNEEMYGEPVKKIIANALDLMKSYFTGLKNIFDIVAAQCSELSPIVDEAFKTIKEDVTKMDYEQDLKQFVDANANVHSQCVLAVHLDTTINEKAEDSVVVPQEKKVEAQPTEEKKEEVQPVEKKEEVKEEQKPVEEKAEDAKPEEKKEENPVEEDNKEDLQEIA